MPVVVGTRSAPAPPRPGRPGRLPAKRFIWTSATGDVLDLSGGQGYTCLPGREGFGLPPREVVQAELPDGGASLQAIRVQPRVMTIPLRVRGATQAEYLQRLRRLQAAMRHPLRDGQEVPGTLTVALPDGSRRSIAAYYNGGLSGEEDPLDDLKLRMGTFPNFELIALDPIFNGGQVSQQWRASAGRAWFGPMPLQLAASQVLGSVVVDLPGDAESQPIWTIVGPGTPTVTNVSTGRSFAFASEISAGRTVTVDTRDDRLTVTDDLGADLYDQLEEWPDLWPLEPGRNELFVEMAGATDASRIGFTATIRWQAAW